MRAEVGLDGHCNPPIMVDRTIFPSTIFHGEEEEYGCAEEEGGCDDIGNRMSGLAEKPITCG
jgi:hypothetical protein